MRRNSFPGGVAQKLSIVLAIMLGVLVWEIGAEADGYKIGQINPTVVFWATELTAVGLELTFLYVTQEGSQAMAMVAITLTLLAYGGFGWMAVDMFADLRRLSAYVPGIPQFLIGLEFLCCTMGLPQVIAMIELMLEPEPDVCQPSAQSPLSIPTPARQPRRQLRGGWETTAAVVVAAIAVRYLTRKRRSA